MNFFQATNRILTGTVCTLLVAAIGAGESFGQEYPAKLFDQSTLGYVHIDFNKLDTDDLFQLIYGAVGEDSDMARETNLAGFQLLLNQYNESFKRAGFGELYIVFSLSDVPSAPPMIFLPADAETQKKFGADLAMLFSMFQRVDTDEGILFGHANSLQRIEHGWLPTRDDVAEVLQHTDGNAITAVLSWSSDQRRAVSETLPAFPAPFDAIDGKALADGASTIAVIVNPSDETKLEIVIRGRDSEANGQLAELFSGEELTQSVAAIPEIPGWVKDLTSIIGKEPLNRDANQFTVQISESDGSLDRLNDGLVSMFAAFHESRRRVFLANQLRQLVLACHNHHDHKKSLPAYASFDEDGNALLSWRVHILPYLEEGNLYKQFRLDEPWDSEHNLKLVKQIPACYQTDPELTAEGKTVYVMPRGDAFVGQAIGVTLDKIKDGTSNTILVAEAHPSAAVIWSKPDDLEIDLEFPLRGLFGPGQVTARFGFADGSVHDLEPDKASIRAHLTTSAGDDP